MKIKIFSVLSLMAFVLALASEVKATDTCTTSSTTNCSINLTVTNFANGLLASGGDYGTVTLTLDGNSIDVAVTMTYGFGLHNLAFGFNGNNGDALFVSNVSWTYAGVNPGVPVFTSIGNGTLDGFGRFSSGLVGGFGFASDYTTLYFTVTSSNPFTSVGQLLAGNSVGVNNWFVGQIAVLSAGCTGWVGNMGSTNPSSSGNDGTGACASSPFPLPPNGLAGLSTQNQAKFIAEPINTANGNHFFQHNDFAVPSRGMPLVFQRTYNSLDNYSGPLGADWTHSYNILLFKTPSGAVIKCGDGHGETYTLSGGVYVPQPGVFNNLSQNSDGTFVLLQKNQTRYFFSASGRLTNIVDKNGNTVSLTYSEAGNLTQITDTVGRNLILSYDGNNRITDITDSIGRTVVYSYSANNDLVQVKDPASGVTQLSYDGSHHVTSIILPNGQTLLQNTYDGQGRVTTQANGRGFVTTFAYNTPSSGQTTITDARGNNAVHTYDSQLRISTETDALGGSVNYAYDSNNDRTAVTNQNGKTTNFTYDVNGNLTSITDPFGKSTTFTYDGKNDLLTSTNPKGNATSFSYDTSGNLLTVLDALGNTTTYTYDSFGQLISKTDGNGHATTYEYDTFGDLSQIRDPLGDVTTLAYDTIGRLTSVTDPNGHAASSTYDALSRLTKVADPLGNQTQFAYDAVGNLQNLTDANGHATAYGYDATNNLVSVIDPLGHETQYAYDANNNRVSFANAKGKATLYAFDPLNRLSSVTDPLSFVTSYSYDPVGNVQSVTDAKGQTNKFAYDALNRLLAISYADGKSVAYAYDPDGNRTSMVDSHGTTGYSYDALDRIASVSDPSGKTVSYTYDATGNRSTLAYPDGKLITYVYDSANRLQSAKDWFGRTTTYAYDPAGNLLSESYPTGAAVSFSYDTASRLTQVANSYRGSTNLPLNPITSFTYMLDPVGNRLQVADGSGKITSYGYDPLNELISVTTGTNVTRFTYDAVGNRTNVTAPGSSINYSYDVGDRLLQAGTITFAYDANGNQITRNIGSVLVNFAYDAANRLTAVTGGLEDTNFVYDGDGNRLSQSIGAGTYTYVNDVATALPVVLQESGPEGNISYSRGLGLISETSPTFDYFYHYDGLGSVVGLTDSNAKLAGRYIYDAWGQAVFSNPDTQIGTKNKFRFTGEALDPLTQLYYLRARYYDPASGRFIQKDPFPGISASSPMARNRFLFATNNPILFPDPSGLFSLGSFTTFVSQAGAVGGTGLILSASTLVGGTINLGATVVGAAADSTGLKSVSLLARQTRSLVDRIQLASATALVETTSQLEGVSLSVEQTQRTASAVLGITNLANVSLSVLNIPHDLTQLSSLQNTINANSMIGKSLVAPTLGQLLSVESLGETAQGVYDQLSPVTAGININPK